MDIHGYSPYGLNDVQQLNMVGLKAVVSLRMSGRHVFLLYTYKYISTLHYGDTGSNHDILYLTQNLAFP